MDGSNLVRLRDRAFIAVMVYSFARVSAVVGLKVEDYYAQKKRWWLRLHEKNGKVNEMPCHQAGSVSRRLSRSGRRRCGSQGAIVPGGHRQDRKIIREADGAHRCLVHGPAPRGGCGN